MKKTIYILVLFAVLSYIFFVKKYKATALVMSDLQKVVVNATNIEDLQNQFDQLDNVPESGLIVCLSTKSSVISRQFSDGKMPYGKNLMYSLKKNGDHYIVIFGDHAAHESASMIEARNHLRIEIVNVYNDVNDTNKE